MDMEILGWNECLITYVLAAASPTHPVSPAAYHRGWVQSLTFRNDRPCYDIGLPLGPDFGGPLFFAHYSFLGLDPRGLRDRYADYRSEEHTSELQSLMRISYAVFCLKKKNHKHKHTNHKQYDI